MAEYQNIAVWDFAYPNGESGLQSGKALMNSFTTQEIDPRTPHRKNRSESAKSFTSVIVGSLHPASSTATDTRCDKSSSKSKSKSKSKRHHLERQEPSQTQKTYLLSIPNTARVYCGQMKSTIATLLLTPHTQLVLLVPQSHIVCQKMCDLGRLPKASGSGLRILPVPPEIVMESRIGAVIGEDYATSLERNLEMLAVEEIATKVVKCTKVRRFDGYLAFEDERASWMFLERVGKAVAGLSEKV
jgi:hypothetical protein